MTGQQTAMNQMQLIERVLELTLAIREAGQIADWQLAARLTEERSPLVHSINRQQDPKALALIRRVQAMDNAIMEDAQRSQTELTNEYQAAMGRAQAAQAYNRVARY